MDGPLVCKGPMADIKKGLGRPDETQAGGYSPWQKERF